MKNLKKVSFIVFLIASLFFVSCSEELTEEKVIYLVRHAEKNLTDTTDNPDLTAEGVDRSNELVKVLNTIKIDNFYSTKYQRNMNTLQPLANFNSKEIKVYEWHDWEPMLEGIKKSKDKTFIISGHGDNLLPMIVYLGATQPIEKLGHEEYDNIFKVTLSNKDTVVEVIKY